MADSEELTFPGGIQECFQEVHYLRHRLEMWMKHFDAPRPWRVERDWTYEVTAADGTTIEKCRTHEEAQAICDRANAIKGYVDIALPEKDAEALQALITSSQARLARGMDYQFSERFEGILARAEISVKARE